jgi:hypothetical protein
MSQPTVRLLDGDLRAFLDLTPWVRRLGYQYTYLHPDETRNRFGFSKEVDSPRGRSATIEFRSEGVLERLRGVDFKNDPVFAAFVLDGELSRWQVDSLHFLAGGNGELRFIQMDPYGEALLRERIVTESRMQDAPSEPTPEPEQIRKPKKRKKKAA